MDGQRTSNHGQLIPVADVEAAVRRYVARIARRYLPLVAGLAAISLVVALVPSVSNNQATVDGFGEVDASSPVATGPESTDLGGQSTEGDQTGGAGSRASGSAPATTSAWSTGKSIGGTLATGKTRTGIACRAGVRQVKWSTYAANCVSAFGGDNGGATAHGVTRSTITMSYRLADSGQSAAIKSVAGSAAKNLDQEAYLHDLRVYVEFFNSQFELYGRKVALKAFKGQGDWVREYQGQAVEGAEADGSSARSMKAFGDLSMAAISSTPPYARALVNNRVISFGGVTLSHRTFRQFAPYAYSFQRTADDHGLFYGNLGCQRMTGLPAIFTSDATYSAKPRVFGLIAPDVPDYAYAGNVTKETLERCRTKLARRVAYSIDFSTFQTQATNIIAQMRSAGVSTVLCICDGLMPVFLTSAATQQQYYPEWLLNGIQDDSAQRYAPDQMEHALSPTGVFRFPEGEAYRVYKLANRDSEPELPQSTLNWAYQAALLTFNALQAAGPSLTPASVQHGFFALPDGPAAGGLPMWSFGTNRFVPVAGLPLGYWDAGAANYSGSGRERGAWVPCAGADGADRRFDDVAAYGPKGTQLRCFGRK